MIMVSPSYLNQHEDLFYRQKYLPTKHWKESHDSNAKYENFGSLRSLAISKKKRSHAINCPGKTGDSAPSTPDKGSVRNFNGRISFYHCWRSNRRPLFAQNSRASGALPPGHPAGTLRRAYAWTPPVYKGTPLPDPPPVRLLCSLADKGFWRHGNIGHFERRSLANYWDECIWNVILKARCYRLAPLLFGGNHILVLNLCSKKKKNAARYARKVRYFNFARRARRFLGGIFQILPPPPKLDRRRCWSSAPHFKKASYALVIHIPSMQFPVLTYGMALYTVYRQNTNIEKIYEYASERRASELGKCLHFHILKLLFPSIFCWYFWYFISETYIFSGLKLQSAWYIIISSMQIPVLTYGMAL